MDVVLTSFGMGMKERPWRSIFRRMPPMYLDQGALEGRGSSRFHIDYAALFMFDRVIVDQQTYEQAVSSNSEDEQYKWLPPDILAAVKAGAAEYAKVLIALQKSGRLVTKDFDEILLNVKPIMEQATGEDLKNVARWTRPLESAVAEWSRVMNAFRGMRGKMAHLTSHESEELLASLHILGNYFGTNIMRADYVLEALRGWKQKQAPELREQCRELLRDYLSYTNFNLLLAFDCQAAFVDWMDMQPVYEEKFREAAKSRRIPVNPHGQHLTDQSRKLFDFLFPYFVPTGISELMRAVEDRRTDKLRQFIRDSVSHGKTFDPRECIQLLRDILKLEEKAVLRRNITGWVTLPLGFIPVIGTPIQKATEEVINRLWSNRPLNQYSWFYLINNLDISNKAVECKE